MPPGRGVRATLMRRLLIRVRRDASCRTANDTEPVLEEPVSGGVVVESDPVVEIAVVVGYATKKTAAALDPVKLPAPSVTAGSAGGMTWIRVPRQVRGALTGPRRLA